MISKSKIILAIIIISIPLFANPTILSDTLYGNQSFIKADSPYMIEHSTYILGGNLIIEAGVEINIVGDYGLFIEGKLQAEGTESDSIVFTSSRSSSNITRWQGIQCKDALSLKYVSLTDAIKGIYVEIDSQSSGNVTIENSSFESISETAIAIYGSNDTLSNSIEISENKIESDSLGLSFSSIERDKYLLIKNNSITVKKNGIVFHNSYNCRPKIINNDITGPSLISGYGVIGLYSGIQLYSTSDPEILIKGNTISSFRYGVHTLHNHDIIKIEKNSISNCTYGFYGQAAQFRYNNFSSIIEYAIYNNRLMALDAKENFWGEDATSEMNLGSNPKNIETIYDSIDIDTLGYVDYSNWLTKKYEENYLQISKQPVDLIVRENTSAVFAIEIENDTGETSYQWYYNNLAISGATSAIHSFNATNSDTSHGYYCEISNFDTTILSTEAQLSIMPPITITYDTTYDYDSTVNSGLDTILTSTTTITMIKTLPFYNIAVPLIDAPTSFSRFHDEIQFYPNPVHQIEKETSFSIPKDMNGSWHISIFDVLGNKINEQEFEGIQGDKYVWNLKNEGGISVSSGFYLAVLRFKNLIGGTQIFKKIIGIEQ